MSDKNANDGATATAPKFEVPVVTDAASAINSLLTLKGVDATTKTFNGNGFATSGVLNVKSPGIANMVGTLVALAAERAANGDEDAQNALATIGACVNEVPTQFATVAEVDSVRRQCAQVNTMRGKSPFTLGEFIKNNIEDSAAWIKSHNVSDEDLASTPSA